MYLQKYSVDDSLRGCFVDSMVYCFDSDGFGLSGFLMLLLVVVLVDRNTALSANYFLSYIVGCALHRVVPK